MTLYMGLMSGTSMDGIDAAIMESGSNRFVHGITRPYAPHVLQRMHNILADERASLAEISQLNTLIGQEFARAALQLLEESGTQSGDIAAIGSHGQTLCHNTLVDIPYTMQSGCAHSIAEMTGITVVADFRTRDVVLGGQGAPFAPIYHQHVFARPNQSLAVVNIGGIANITLLNGEHEVRGYDVGPGNCLMDAWTARHLHQSYDKGGEWALSGRVIDELLQRMLDDAWFRQAAPKSIGKEYFSLAWLDAFLTETYAACDVQATLLQLTATGIANEAGQNAQRPQRLLLCGGGVHNAALLQCLRALLPEMDVDSTERFQVSPDYLEAMMFAWLAEKSIHGQPLNMQSVTGAKRPAVAGVVYPAGLKQAVPC